MLQATLVPMQSVAELLDGLPGRERMLAVRNLGRREQRNLWNAAESFAEIGLDHLVPTGTPPWTEVRHHGRNTLPAFTAFEKRFYRDDAAAQVYGANFQSTSWLTGPGYFTVTTVPTRRELLIDYATLPTRAPDGWPEIVPGTRGLSRLVFGGLTDHLRRVSEHVSIGMPLRHGKPLGSWFVLCRDTGASG